MDVAGPDDKILVRYVGWGGLPQAFDARNEKWAAEYQELQSLLAPGITPRLAVPPRTRTLPQKPSSRASIRG